MYTGYWTYATGYFKINTKNKKYPLKIQIFSNSQNNSTYLSLSNNRNLVHAHRLFCQYSGRRPSYNGNFRFMAHFIWSSGHRLCVWTSSGRRAHECSRGAGRGVVSCIAWPDCGGSFNTWSSFHFFCLFLDMVKIWKSVKSWIYQLFPMMWISWGNKINLTFLLNKFREGFLSLDLKKLIF